MCFSGFTVTYPCIVLPHLDAAFPRAQGDPLHSSMRWVAELEQILPHFCSALGCTSEWHLLSLVPSRIWAFGVPGWLGQVARLKQSQGEFSPADQLRGEFSPYISWQEFSLSEFCIDWSMAHGKKLWLTADSLHCSPAHSGPNTFRSVSSMELFWKTK